MRPSIAAGDLSSSTRSRCTTGSSRQRWFGSKAREVARIDVRRARPAARASRRCSCSALVEARFPPGTHELYQVPLGLRPADEGWSERVIAEADGWTVYDALADPAHGARAAAPDALATPSCRPARATLSFRWAESAGAALGGTVDVRPVGVEQSNSSIVFGDALILKVFRRVEPGVNPELELLRFLSARGSRTSRRSPAGTSTRAG